MWVAAPGGGDEGMRAKSGPEGGLRHLESPGAGGEGGMGGGWVANKSEGVEGGQSLNSIERVVWAGRVLRWW